MTTTNKRLKGDGQTQATQSMQVSLQSMPLIMNNIPQAVFWKDKNLVYLGCNQAFAARAGLSSPEEIIGKTDHDLPWKDQAELYRADDCLVMEQGQPKLNYEETQTTPDGSTIWLRTSKIPIRENGQIVAVLGMYEDITEYKKAQEATVGERQRFQIILETVRVPTIISRLSDGIVLYANQAIAQISQVNLDKLIGFKTGNFYANPDDQEKIRAALRTAGHIDDFEVQFRRTDGSLYWALLSSRIVKYEGETCVLSSYVDITERKQVEQALRDSEARYSAVVTQAKDGVVIIQDNLLQFVNDAMATMMGYTAAEMVNTPIINYIAPESRELIVNRIKARLAGQEVPNIYEARLQRKDGTLIDAELSAGVIEYRGRPADVGMIRDITERKRGEEAVHESEERFRRFTEATSEGLVFHEQGKIIDANPAGLAMFGLTQSSDFIGRNLLEFVMPEFRQLIMEKMQLEDVPPYEVRCRRADGSIFPVETATRTYQTGERTIRATSIRDITERKQAEEALRAHDEFSQKQSSVFAELTRSEALYSGNLQAAFAAVTEAAASTLNIQRSSIWYYNEDRTEIRCMDLFEQGKGHSAGIVLSQADFPAYFKALEDEKVIAADNAHTDPATHEFSAVYLTPLGINSMLDAPIRLRGRVIGVICNEHVGPFRSWSNEEQNFARTIVDFVTVAVETQERKQAEAELQESEAQLSSALRAANMGHWEFDLPTQTFTFNDQYYSLHGRTAQEIGGYQMSTQRFAQELVYPEDAATVGQTIQKALESPDLNLQLQSEARIMHADGKPRWVAVWFRVERDAQGSPVKLHGVNQDITERKRLEAQVHETLERRGLQVQLSTRVAQTIAAATSLEELYQRVVAQVKEQFDYYYTQILRYDPAQEAVVLVSGYGEVGAQMLAAEHRLPVGQGLIGTAAATGETVLRSALQNDPDWHPHPLLPETKGEIAVPIKLGDTVLGVLDVQSNVTGALDADDQLLLEGLCGQIATALESTRLRQEMTERLEEINRLYRAMSHEGWQTYRSSADLPTGLMYDQAGLRPVQDSGLAEELFARVPLTVPGGEVIGTLAVAEDPQRPLSPEDEDFLQQVSQQVALALESARLFEQTEQQRGQLNEAMGIAKLANWEYDVNRDRFIFNDHFYSIFHTSVEQVGAYEISSAEYAERFVHPDDRPLVGKEIGKALSSTDRHYNVQLEHRILFTDGGIGHISVNVHIERDEQGNIIRYYGANQDITERKLAEDAIAKRAAELATVAQVSTTTSTALDPDVLLQSVVNLTKERFNLYHAHIYLVDPERNELVLTAGAGEIGRKMLAEGWSIPVDHELSIIADAYRKRQSVIANDVHHDQDSTFLSNRLLPNTRSEVALPLLVGDQVLGVFDVQSEQANYFAAEDVNIYTTLSSQVAVALQNARLYVEQARTVAQLRELDKLKSSFLANMSHELRTPLNSILGFADVILEELDGPLTENMNNDLRLIQKNGQHLLHLINDVLDMAKIEAGRMNLSPERFTAFEMLEEVTSITSTLASEKNLSLFIDEDSDQDVQIYADRTRMRQVMINLVNNAIKFTETGKISLKLASLSGARILISVKDTGIGIPPDKLEPIFQEFTQVDASSTRKAGGTGLGLPISRRLVEMHGGRLWAESTGIPGEGSTFFVELPVEARITETVEKQVK